MIANTDYSTNASPLKGTPMKSSFKQSPAEFTRVSQISTAPPGGLQSKRRLGSTGIAFNDIQSPSIQHFTLVSGDPKHLESV